MPLPTLCDTVTVSAMRAQKTALCLMAEDLIRQGGCDDEFTDKLRDHLAAVALATELGYCHESESPADEIPHCAAEQLMAWHLAALDSMVNTHLKD